MPACGNCKHALKDYPYKGEDARTIDENTGPHPWSWIARCNAGHFVSIYFHDVGDERLIHLNTAVGCPSREIEAPVYEGPRPTRFERTLESDA